MAGADVVAHLAWSSVPRTAALDPMGDARINLEGGLRLLEAAINACARRFIFLSSGGTVYGPRRGSPITEDSVVDPIDAHACGKVLFEHYVRTRAEHGRMEHIILRPVRPLGPRIARRVGMQCWCGT